MPTDSAAFGFSPTERILKPIVVLYRKNHTTKIMRNATYVRIFCPDRILPRMGMSFKIGISKLGTARLATSPEVFAFCPVARNMTNTVPPTNAVFIAILVKYKSHFKTNAA